VGGMEAISSSRSRRAAEHLQITEKDSECAVVRPLSEEKRHLKRRCLFFLQNDPESLGQPTGGQHLMATARGANLAGHRVFLSLSVKAQQMAKPDEDPFVGL